MNITTPVNSSTGAPDLASNLWALLTLLIPVISALVVWLHQPTQEALIAAIKKMLDGCQKKTPQQPTPTITAPMNVVKVVTGNAPPLTNVTTAK